MSGLVERLLKQAQSASEASKMLAQAKSLRQDHNPPRDDLYAWATPEQTLEAQAAARITALEAENERIKVALRESGNVLDTADRLIERGYGVDTPAERSAEYQAFAAMSQAALGGLHDAD